MDNNEPDHNFTSWRRRCPPPRTRCRSGCVGMPPPGRWRRRPARCSPWCSLVVTQWMGGLAEDTQNGHEKFALIFRTLGHIKQGWHCIKNKQTLQNIVISQYMNQSDTDILNQGKKHWWGLPSDITNSVGNLPPNYITSTRQTQHRNLLT